MDYPLDSPKALRVRLALLGIGNALRAGQSNCVHHPHRMYEVLLRKKLGRSGFEPLKAMPADLQSAPFGHFGTYPFYSPIWEMGVVKDATSSPNRPSESIGV